MLECRSLSVVYGKKISALKDVSLKVDQGEIVTVIGANGSGKTTLLKAISGVFRLDEGEVSFEGGALSGVPMHKIARLGIAHVPEGRRIFSRLTVLENLELGAYGQKKAILDKRLEEAYRIFPLLKERASQLGGTLSGGEQQMLAIARALMAEPKLLLLDEPSMGLAPVIVEKIYSTIKNISRQGLTILLVEQNAQISLSIAKRGYVLENGQIALSGLSGELLNNPLVQEAYLG